jgi:hypothetical protein
MSAMVVAVVASTTFCWVRSNSCCRMATVSRVEAAIWAGQRVAISRFGASEGPKNFLTVKMTSQYAASGRAGSE